MRRDFGTILPLLSALLLVGACDDDEPMEPGGPFDLTFQGDATFQGAHGGQDIAVALVAADGTVLETLTGTVSEVAEPAFTFTFGDALTAGASYQVDYWIDSNFGGGDAGTCDPPENDHQWRRDVPAVEADVLLTETHQPSEVTSVCDSF